MQYNYNPQGYSFTSSIPDIFKVSDFQGSSVYLAIYINRSEEPIFSTTLYAYNGQASIYDLRSIIESYMEEKQLTHATCSFRLQENRNDYTIGEFTLIYCRILIQQAVPTIAFPHPPCRSSRSAWLPNGFAVLCFPR